MKKLSLLLFFSSLLSICVAQEHSKKSSSDNKLKSGLDSLVSRSIEPFMQGSAHVGLSIGIIKDGKSYLYNYGSTQRDKVALPTGNTVYELASITKTFGSTLLAKAVLDKKVGLGDDITKYLKEPYPNLSFSGTPITLLNLANLTSGLPNWMPDRDIFAGASPDSIPFILNAVHSKYSRADFFQDLHSTAPKIKPGTLARHCNTAAQLLGFFMEGVYGRSFDELLRTEFVVPLKMKNTVLLKAGRLPAGMAKGYDGKGRVMPVTDWEDLQVAASIASSSSDMLKYMAYQLNEANPAIKLSHEPTFGNLADGAIALNWKIRKPLDGKRSVSHTGGSLGFSSYIVFYPEQQMGIVLLANDGDMGTQNELITLSEKILRP